MKPKFTQINHVTLLVKNREASVEFFVEKLGFEQLSVGKSIWLKVGRQFIHISESSGSPVKNTFYHFAVEVENFQKYIENLISKQLGLLFMNADGNLEAVKNIFNIKNNHFFLRDPDGNLLEFIEAGNKFFNQ